MQPLQSIVNYYNITGGSDLQVLGGILEHRGGGGFDHACKPLFLCVTLSHSLFLLYAFSKFVNGFDVKVQLRLK